VMDNELQKQYEIKGMEGILLSRRFGKDDANNFREHPQRDLFIID
jgi:hypothetical protein